MSVTTQAKWDAPTYRRIASASPKGDKLIVLFEDRSWVELNREQVIRPDAQGVRWEELTWTPYEVIVPTVGDPVEIPWSTIRALSDKEYSAHLAAAAEVEAQQIGLRLRELREQRGITGKELAERVNIAPQSLSRIELGRHDIALSTLHRLLAAMGYTFADLVATPQEPVPVAAVMRRLAAVGIDRDFVLRRLLPRRLRERLSDRSDGSDDGSLAEQVAAAVGGIFGWSTTTILGNEPLTLDHALPQGTRFKLAVSADKMRATAYTAYAHTLARIVRDAAQERDLRPVPSDPNALRQAIVEHYGAFTFETLLRYVWDLGIPVIPLRDPGAFHGACWLMERRPIIVLKQLTNAQARWMFDLLHELRHVASHLSEEYPSIVEKETISPHASPGEEREASRFAGDAILFGRAEELAEKSIVEAHGKTERLKWAVQRVAETEQVPVDALANYIAFRLSHQNQNWWGVANNLQVTDPAPWMTARDLLLENIDRERLDPRARAMLQRALSNDEE